MTDAIHYEENLPGSGQYRSWNSTIPPPMIDYTIPDASYAKEDRPKSQSVHKSKDGWRSPTSWNHSHTVIVNPYIDFKEKYNGWTYEGHGDTNLFRTGDLNLISASKVEDQAVNKALLKLSDQKTSLGENFAERDQASRMIADRLSQVGRSIGRFKHLRPRDWIKVKKLTRFGPKRQGAIPNAWLELQYGWNPLLGDIHGAYELMKDIDKENSTFRVTAKGSAVDRSTDSFDRYVSIPGMPVFGLAHFVRDHTVKSFVRLDYVMSNPALHELQQVDVTNPLLLAWNLLPYSFVVDWFLPIGNYLQSWTADLGLSFKGGSLSTKNQCVGRINGRKPYYGRNWGTFSGGQVYRKMTFNRWTFSSSPAPRIPNFKNPLSYDHVANALSLLINFLK